MFCIEYDYCHFFYLLFASITVASGTCSARQTSRMLGLEIARGRAHVMGGSQGGSRLKFSASSSFASLRSVCVASVLKS